MILLLHRDEHDLRRDEQLCRDKGVVRRDGETWFSTTTSILLIFLPFLQCFARFSLILCKTLSSEELDHSLAIMV